VTLPFMLAFQDPVVGPELARVLERRPRGDPDYEQVVSLVRQSGAVAATERAAQEFAAMLVVSWRSSRPRPHGPRWRRPAITVVGRRI